MPYKDPEKARQYNKTYRTTNREKIKAQKDAYRAVNKEKIAAYSAAYYAANKEKIRNATDPQKIAAYNLTYRTANRENIINKHAVYKLTKLLGVNKSEIPSKLIEAKLAVINIKRKVKEITV